MGSRAMPYDRPLMTIVRPDDEQEEEARMGELRDAEEDQLQPCSRFQWERIVRRVAMPPAVKLLALTLATYANGDGTRVRPGVARLAAVTGQGQTTVRRQLRCLRVDYSLLQETARGGGRGHAGRTATYRLVIPVDLLDRAQLLPPDEYRDDSPSTTTDTQSTDSPSTQEDDESAVDNSHRESIMVDAQSSESPPTQVDDENDFHRPPRASSGALSVHIGPIDRPPEWTTTTQDHPLNNTSQVGHLSTQPPDRAREPAPLGVAAVRRPRERAS